MGNEAITSAAAFFRAANGKRVTRTAEGMATAETWEASKAEATRQLLAQGCPADKIEERDGALHWPGGFLLKPKYNGTVAGVFHVRSADYTFTPDGHARPIYGEKKGARVEGGALVKDIGNGARYVYRIIA